MIKILDMMQYTSQFFMNSPCPKGLLGLPNWPNSFKYRVTTCPTLVTKRIKSSVILLLTFYSRSHLSIALFEDGKERSNLSTPQFNGMDKLLLLSWFTEKFKESRRIAIIIALCNFAAQEPVSLAPGSLGIQLYVKTS